MPSRRPAAACKVRAVSLCVDFSISGLVSRLFGSINVGRPAFDIVNTCITDSDVHSSDGHTRRIIRRPSA